MRNVHPIMAAALRGVAPEPREPDEDARREAIEERRARFNGCRCNFEMPGHCPGWRSCPMQAETVEDENE